MFETLKNVFRVKEMRRKLLYLIWMIFIIRIGCQIPVPGVDSDFFKQWFSSNAGDAFNFFDAFTGGQMPLYRRLPKRGFKNRNTKEIIAINVDVLNRFEDGAEVTAESLLASGAISKIADGVKILGNGELTKKLNVKVNAVSETAKSKIEAAGGTVEVI